MLGFPSFGVWGAMLVWGGWTPGLGVGPAGLLFCALGKYPDLAENWERCDPQNPEQEGAKISRDRPRGLSWLVGAMGHE